MESDWPKRNRSLCDRDHFLALVWKYISVRRLYTCLPYLYLLSHFQRGVYAVGSRPSAGVQTVRASSIDVLAFHLAVLGTAMLTGYGLKQGLIAIESTSQKLKDLNFLSGIPLFPLCMAGGIIIQVRR